MKRLIQYIKNLFKSKTIIICENNKNSKIVINGKVIFDDTNT